MISAKIKIDSSKLEGLIKKFSGKSPIGKLGILDDAPARTNVTGEQIDNATLGYVHEFGDQGQEERSWLRASLMGHFPKEIAIPSDVTPKGIVTELCKSGYDAIQGAFDSEGYGAWPPSYAATSEGRLTLVDTEQLRESVSYKVEE